MRRWRFPGICAAGFVLNAVDFATGDRGGLTTTFLVVFALITLISVHLTLIGEEWK
jgi:hypothetical protein